MNHTIIHTYLSECSFSGVRKNYIRIISFLLFCIGTLPGGAQKADTLSLLFVGDLMQHRAQIEAAQTEKGTYDYSNCFTLIKPELKNNDLTIANLEVTFGGKPYTGYPSFSAPDEFLYSIHKAGFNVLTTANNHCLDRGRHGMERTLNLLDSLHIAHAGTYRSEKERIQRHPLLIEKRGFRIALLNYTYGTNGIKISPPSIVNYIDKQQIRKDILRARLMKPDAIIACIHWGIEYHLHPRKEEKELAQWMLRLGVDHIIGSHPHVIQPIQLTADSLKPSQHVIAYSLGNFISNMSAPQTDGGLAVKLVLRKVEKKTRLQSCQYAFIWTSRSSLSSNRNFQVYPASIKSNSQNSNEIYHLNKYLRTARSFMKKYSSDLKEYFFTRK